MKKYIVLALVSVLFGAVLSSCRKDEPLDENSIIMMDNYVQNDFDKWLEANYVNPYNINSMTMSLGLGTLKDRNYTYANCLIIEKNRNFKEKL